MCNTNIPPDYFFDEMSWDEVNVILEENNEKYKTEWERIRWSAYIMAITQGAKLKSPTDIIEFNWEKKEDEEMVYTQEDIETMQQRMLDAFYNKETRPFEELIPK